MSEATNPAARADRVSTVERDGLVLDVLDAGPLDGEPIVLLHGFPERATTWRHVAPLLQAAGYRTLALDQRGYSPRARPRRRRDYRAPELAADVLALVDAVAGPTGRVHLVGHDWGAIPAWLLAQHHPERVRSLTAVSVPHPEAFLAAMVRSRQWMKSWYMLVFQLPFLPEWMLSNTSDRSARQMRAFGMSDDDIAHFRAEIVADGVLPTAINWYRAMPLTHPRAMRGRVTVPTTMVWSDGDTAVGRWGPEHSVRWVDAPFELVELAGVSHWIPTQAPEALAEAILRRAGSGR